MSRFPGSASLCALVLSACGVPDFDPDLTVAENVDRVVRARVDENDPGLAVIVADADGVLLRDGWGLADLDAELAFEPSTPCYLASVAKSVTATMVLQLVQDGQLALGDRLGDLLDDVPDVYADVTVEQLLSHSSGVPDYFRLAGARGWAGFDRLAGTTNTDVVDAVWAEGELTYAPGSTYTYSNSGYVLLSEIVAAVSGRSYAAQAAARVFGPAGMDGASVLTGDPADTTGRARGYDAAGRDRDINLRTTGDGGIVASADDLVGFAAAWDDGRLLDASLREAAERPRPEAPREGRSAHGLGWWVGEAEGERTVAGIGAYGGFATELYRVPERELVVVVLATGGRDWAYDLPGAVHAHLAAGGAR